LFVVGGAHYDYLPFRGQPPAQPLFARERIADPIFVAEMIDLTASAQPWLPCTPHVSPRLYHSVALLLPDARVLVAGGYMGKKPNPTTPVSAMTPEERTYHDWEDAHSDLEIFSPDYLFAGARPQILAITGGNTISYSNGTTNNNFEISVDLPGSTNPAATIGSVCLVSPGSVTHHFDWDQRFVHLHFAPALGSNKKLVITPPADAFIAPPGHYMLFVTTSAAATNGTKIPSIAAFVKLQ
jgi:hypothetical protein